MDQLNQILHYLGSPSEEALGRVGSARVSYSIISIIRTFFTENKNNRHKIIFDLYHLKSRFLLWQCIRGQTPSPWTLFPKCYASTQLGA